MRNITEKVKYLYLTNTFGGELTMTAVVVANVGCCGDEVFLAESAIGLCLILFVEDKVAAR